MIGVVDSDLERAEALLGALADGGHGPVDASQILVVVAHPDDETLMLGAQLPRLAGVRILHVTDGAPRDGLDAIRHGFDCADSYGQARRRELEAAMTLAGVPHSALSQLLVPDQEASSSMGWIALHLRDRLDGTRLVFTHAYEGGHPDHDATALAVHMAAELILGLGGEPPTIVDAPLYREGPDGWEFRSFAREAEGRIWRFALTPAQIALKQALVAAFVSQHATLHNIPLDIELFRLAPKPDFARLPNRGRLLYERYGWGMTGERFMEAVRDARRLAGLPDAPQ